MYTAVVLACITSLMPLVSTSLISFCKACEGEPSHGRVEEPRDNAKVEFHAFWILLPGRHLTKKLCAKPLVFTYHIPIAVYFYSLLKIWSLTLKLLCSKTPYIVNVGSIHTSQNLSANLLVGKVAGFCLGRKIPNHKPLHHHFHYLDSTTLPLPSDTFSTTWRAPSTPLHPLAVWQSCFPGFPGSNSSTFTCLRGRSEGRGEEGNGSRWGGKKKITCSQEC